MSAAAKSELRLKFFDLLFNDQEGVLCLATTDPRAPKATFEQHFFKWPDEIIKVEEFILRVERDKNVYFCINLLTTSQRKKENCLHTKLVWADLDNVNPETIEDIPPPIVIRSSPGRWQAIWRLTVPLPPFEAEEYSRRIAYKIGADKSGWDLTQLLRVPFTANFKYNPPSLIEVERCLETEAKPLIFESLPSTIQVPDTPVPDSLGDMTSEHVIYKYRIHLEKTSFLSYYTEEPMDDWSSTLWKVINECFRAGMTPEETFIVAKDAKCNKYARDGRPVQHLWNEVLKAAENYTNVVVPMRPVEIPHLVDTPYSDTFIKEYRAWGELVTDAVPEFHELCMMVALSSIISNSVRAETSAGMIVPNLWGILLGDSTLTRKTTAMRLVMDMLVMMDNELVVATDGSPEGLLSALEARPNRTSIFFKDELSGFFETMARKEYLAGMQETLTALYDVPPIFTRRLRKETIIIESPAFIFLGGGIPETIYAAVDDSFVYSGFLPRFLVVKGKAEKNRYRPLGPPTEESIKGRQAIFNKLADLTEIYSGSIVQKLSGQQVMVPKRYTAKLKPDAWIRYESYERTMIDTARDSVVPNLALPTFERLSRSLLKMAVIFGAIRQKPNNEGVIFIEEGDVIDAAWYIQKWGVHSIELFTNAGKGSEEKFLERVYDLIKEHPGVGRSAIMRVFHLNSKETTAVLLTLEERGMIKSEKRGKGTSFWIT